MSRGEDWQINFTLRWEDAKVIVDALDLAGRRQ